MNDIFLSCLNEIDKMFRAYGTLDLSCVFSSTDIRYLRHFKFQIEVDRW